MTQAIKNQNEQYIKKIWKQIKNTQIKKKVENHLVAKRQQLEKSIQNKIITISETQNNMPQRKKVENQPSQQRLRGILNKKQQMLQKLNMLSMEESRIKQSRHITYQKNKIKSQLSQEDIKKIRQLSKAQKKFQKQLQLKTLEYEQKLLEFKKQEKQLLQKQMKQQSKLKKQAIEKRLQQLRETQQQRQRRHEESQQLIKQLKSKKLMYQNMEQKWKQLEEIQKKKRQQKKQELRRQKSTDFNLIKEHQQKYQQILSKQKQQRQKKIQIIKSSLDQKQNKYVASKFFTFIKQQEQNRQKEKINKTTLPKIYTEKRLQYAEKVKNQIMPNMKIKQTEKKQQNITKQSNFKSMSIGEVHQLGNQYMKTSKQLINRTSKQKQIQEPKKNQYKNYLQDLKNTRTLNQKSHPKNDFQKLKMIMEKDNNMDEQKIIKIKYLAKKIQQQAGKDSNKLIDSIQAKLQILKKIA